MKKIIKYLLFIAFYVSSISLVIANESGVNDMWKWVAENNYIFEDGIVGTEDIYGFTFLLKSYNKGQYEPVNGNKIQYTLSQYTIDCEEKSYKIGVIDSYGYHDNFVAGDYNKYAEFQPIVQGTAVSAVYKKLCRPIN